MQNDTINRGCETALLQRPGSVGSYFISKRLHAVMYLRITASGVSYCARQASLRHMLVLRPLYSAN